MIFRLSANQATFHPVTFKEGLNLVVAERSEKSTRKDSRNGVGKSTLIDIIDFCLGSDFKKGHRLRIDTLKTWKFTLEMTVAEKPVAVTRAIASPQHIWIEGSTDGWPVASAQTPEKKPYTVFTLAEWRQILGWAFFGMDASLKTPKYTPTYRSLVSYFVRHDHDAYLEPFSHTRAAKIWNIQVNMAFLLGMNWEYAASWQNLRDRAKDIAAVKSAVKNGAFSAFTGSVGELEAKKIQLLDQKKKIEDGLATFKVHPQYEALQEQADTLTTEIHELVNQNLTDRRRMDRYADSIREETVPAPYSIEQLYEEIGLHFPDAVKKTLDEARVFHHQIIANRRDFLELELSRLKEKLAGREQEIKSLAEKRSEILKILSTHGAFQEMVQLQNHLTELTATLAQVEHYLHETKRLKHLERDIKTEKETLLQLTEQDHEERRETWTEAVRLFNENSRTCYKSPGVLAINIEKDGYRFSIEMERTGSGGVEKTKIFCFDLTLFQMQKELGRDIDFLIHDSVIYDGVDPRQTAMALHHAHEVATALGGQYICTINSDMIPVGDFPEGFDYKDHVCLTLSDLAPEDRLLGIGFERQGKEKET